MITKKRNFWSTKNDHSKNYWGKWCTQLNIERRYFSCAKVFTVLGLDDVIKLFVDDIINKLTYWFVLKLQRALPYWHRLFEHLILPPGGGAYLPSLSISKTRCARTMIFCTKVDYHQDTLKFGFMSDGDFNWLNDIIIFNFFHFLSFFFQFWIFSGVFFC